MTAGESDSMDLKLSEWKKSDYNAFTEYLKSKADIKYRDFQSSLVPGMKNNYILGVRMPVLRDMGKEIAKGNPKSYLNVSSNDFYEERMLKGIVLGLIKTESFDEFVMLCDDFVSEIDNWAICDCFCVGLKHSIKIYKEEFFEYINKYIKSANVWSVRLGLVIMLDYYLDSEHIDIVLDRCDSITSDFYYVSMAQAWLVATAFAKCRDKTMLYMHNNSLDDVTFNKAVQKCIESKRIDKETKDYLKSLKRY